MSYRDENSLFKECPTCAAKPGSPTLCPSCLHNRSVISTLSKQDKQKGEGMKIDNSQLAKMLRDAADFVEKSNNNEIYKFSFGVNTERPDIPRRDFCICKGIDFDIKFRIL